MTDTEIATIAGVTRQAVSAARLAQSAEWSRRYARIAAGQPDPGPRVHNPSWAARLAAAGTTQTAIADALGIKRRSVFRALIGQAPPILARIEAHLATLEAAQ